MTAPSSDELFLAIAEMRPCGLVVSVDSDLGAVELQLRMPEGEPLRFLLGIAPACDLAMRLTGAAVRAHRAYREGVQRTPYAAGEGEGGAA